MYVELCDLIECFSLHLSEYIGNCALQDINILLNLAWSPQIRTPAAGGLLRAARRWLGRGRDQGDPAFR